jgi:hypothetical protein
LEVGIDQTRLKGWTGVGFVKAGGLPRPRSFLSKRSGQNGGIAKPEVHNNRAMAFETRRMIGASFGLTCDALNGPRLTW